MVLAQLIDERAVDIEGVARRTLVIGPDVRLHESHAIERAQRQSAAAVSELLGVRERAANTLDLADLAANVMWRAAVARRKSSVRSGVA